MREYKEIISLMKKQPAINHTGGIVHFTYSHKRIFIICYKITLICDFGGNFEHLMGRFREAFC